MRGAIAILNVLHREFDTYLGMHVLTATEVTEYTQSPPGLALRAAKARLDTWLSRYAQDSHGKIRSHTQLMVFY